MVSVGTKLQFHRNKSSVLLHRRETISKILHVSKTGRKDFERVYHKDDECLKIRMFNLM